MDGFDIDPLIELGDTEWLDDEIYCEFAPVANNYSITQFLKR